MATIDDLKQSITEMPKERALDIVLDARKRRRQSPKKKKKKSKSKSSESKLEKAIENMTLEELEELEKALGGGDE